MIHTSIADTATQARTSDDYIAPFWVVNDSTEAAEINIELEWQYFDSIEMTLPVFTNKNVIQKDKVLKFAKTGTVRKYPASASESSKKRKTA